MLSWDYNKIKDDVLLSSEVLGGANIFCYPFGQYNDLDIKVLEENGYKMAFKYGPNSKDYKKANRSDDLFEIPRLNVSHGMSILKFALRLFSYN